MTLLAGISLDQYKVQAKDLLKQARAGDPIARFRIQHHHPEGDALIASGHLRLVDSQLVIARELGYRSWAKLKQDLLFRNAVAAIDAGDLTRLSDLLQKHPSLISYRQRVGEWYEAGYFWGATLLHHIAGNPIRCSLPANILDIARLLLLHSADPNVVTLGGATTCELLLTSQQASEANVALPLVDLLRAAGAQYDLSGPDLLFLPLMNAAPATAAALVQRGAAMDLRYASALGRIERLEALLAEGADALQCEEALVFACIRGQAASAHLLLHHGARGDILMPPASPQSHTALHEAAGRGHLDIVKLLLDHNADATVVEPRWGGTALGWARHSGHPSVVALLEEHLAEG